MLEANFDFGDWDVESLRVSIFHPSGSSRSTRSGLWKEVTGTEPESTDSRPREGVARELGVIGGNNLVLSTQRGRIDWLVQPALVVPNQQAGTPQTLNDLGNALPTLRRAIKCSLETVSPIQRMAFAPALVKQVSDLTMAISQLSRYLPRLDLDGLEGFDFIYQVNRRRRSESVRRVRINRLAKWSTAQVGSLEVQMRPSGEPLIQSTGVSFVRKLDLDVNTAPEAGAMSSDKILGLFDELATLAIELATDGDTS